MSDMDAGALTLLDPKIEGMVTVIFGSAVSLSTTSQYPQVCVEMVEFKWRNKRTFVTEKTPKIVGGE